MRQRDTLLFLSPCLLASIDVGGDFGGFIFQHKPGRWMRVEFPLSDDMRAEPEVFSGFVGENIVGIRELAKHVVAKLPAVERAAWDERRIAKVTAEQVSMSTGTTGMRLDVQRASGPVEVPEVRLIGYMIYEGTRAAKVRELALA